jgi:hypothetical protein
MVGIRAAAHYYFDKGWKPTPIVFKAKNPIREGWQKEDISREQIPALFDGERNIGLRTGTPSGNLLDVDLDSQIAVRLAPEFLPSTSAIFGRKGKPNSHWLYIVDGNLTSEKFEDSSDTEDEGGEDNDTKQTLVEIRSDGRQTVVPPSVHESGEQITWREGAGDPAVVSAPVLRVSVITLAITVFLTKHWPKSEGTRQDYAMAAAGILCLHSFSEADTLRIIQVASRSANDDPADFPRRMQAVEHTYQFFREGKDIFEFGKFAELTSKTSAAVLRTYLRKIRTSELPHVILSGRPVRDVVHDAIRALEKANTPPVLFSRSGTLARVKTEETGRVVAERLTVDTLKNRLWRVADLFIVNKNGSQSPALQIDAYARDLLSLGSWSFPRLDAITTVPVLRPSGSIVDTPGYDPDTYMLYRPTEGLCVPPVPDNPMQDDVRKAAALIDELLHDFPWVEDADRANMWALLLTPIVRPAISGLVPLALIDKPQRGTGASLLAKIAAIIATGRPPDMHGAPSTDEEWDKRITSLLLEGLTFIIFDNVEKPIESGSLSRALTAEIYGGRRLGKNESLALPQKATWVATGNNIQVRGDLPRRVYRVRINAKTARPWERPADKFLHPDLVEWVKEKRSEILWALLTLARAWFKAGRPAPAQVLGGGYEGWSQVVGGIIKYVGIDGFLGNLDALYAEMSTEDMEVEAFFEACYETFKKPMLASTIVGQMQAGVGVGLKLRDTLPSELTSVEVKFLPKRLGEFFGKKVEVRYNSAGLRVEREFDRKDKVSLWKFVKDGENNGSSR